MSRVVKRSAAKPFTRGSRRGGRTLSPLLSFTALQLSRPVEKAHHGLKWLHEINLDGFLMAAPSGLAARNSSRSTGPANIQPAEVAKPISNRPESSLGDLAADRQVEVNADAATSDNTEPEGQIDIWA